MGSSRLHLLEGNTQTMQQKGITCTTFSEIEKLYVLCFREFEGYFRLFDSLQNVDFCYSPN